MNSTWKSVWLPDVLAGTVEVNLSLDCTQLIGKCPACGHRLHLDLGDDGSQNLVVSCRHCQGLYHITQATGEAAASAPSGLSITYAASGEWEVPRILEYLFDNVGVVDYLQEGFVCYPDDHQIDCPTIMVDESSRRIRFGLFGYYGVADATAIINGTVAEFDARFQLDLRPCALARWEYQETSGGFILVERRRMGVLKQVRLQRPAHA